MSDATAVKTASATPSSSASPIIKVQQLAKTFRVGDVEVHALRGVNLEVAKGEFIAVVGSSGSGKSTLFNILGGLTPATSGSVHIDSRDLGGMTNAERTELRKHTVGFVFQKYNLLPTLTAEDNIRLVQFIGGRDTAFTESFQKVLHLLGIADRLRHKPRALSGGQQQRVAIAAPSSMSLPSCSPTNPPETLTVKTPPPSSNSSRTLTSASVKPS
jgi:putative ABC transport system ATP-binding protein